ncbi:unnamed protein product [Zymoseptoria tritici ST99CH_1E4]|uniref:Uncharacterized protein n=1 Tax=Zymoseptoria tritici ST99CH_1E4 TaxID=1276532 RepID=A0A2H1GTQ4_ZYMTR|nr:unnamed protein product [Zymoseptoria tritici ST99CH_1E4]
MSHSIASALSEKDSNLQPAQQNNPKSSAAGEENKSLDTEQHKQVLEKISEQNKQPGTYVSPSDAILSPASSKLAGFKQRQINKQNNNKNPTARSLFSRTISTNSTLEDAEDAGSK